MMLGHLLSSIDPLMTIVDRDTLRVMDQVMARRKRHIAIENAADALHKWVEQECWALRVAWEACILVRDSRIEKTS